MDTRIIGLHISYNSFVCGVSFKEQRKLFDLHTNTFCVITSDQDVMFSPKSVCLFVCA